MVTSITEQLWTSADYAPLASRIEPAISPLMNALHAHPRLNNGARVLDIGAGHGHLTKRLVGAGFDVTALEPVRAMIRQGQRRCPQATWMQAFGEATGLADDGFEAIASNFGSFICTTPGVGDEWARILAPGAPLLMTAWDSRGFFADMTLRMEACFRPHAVLPPHMRWAEPGVARERLGEHFATIDITEHEIAWNFDSVDAGMNFYLHGCPIHAFAFQRSDEKRRLALVNTLREHLVENVGPDATISSFAGFVLIKAIAR